MTVSPYFAHTDPIYKDLPILPFDKIFIDKIAIAMFKVEYELLPKSVIQMFSKYEMSIHMIPEKIFVKGKNWYKEFYISQRQNMECYSFENQHQFIVITV